MGRSSSGSGRGAQFIAGAKAMSPLLVGAAPFAVITGIVAINVGMSPALAVVMSTLVFAGSSQLVAVQLLGIHSPIPVVVLSSFVVNLRFLMYSASLAPFLKRLSGLWKCALAYMLTDQSFAISIVHYHGLAERDPAAGESALNGQWYFLGASVAMWITWQAFTIVGVFVGARIPQSWPFDFAVPLTFLALAVPTVRDRPTAMAALSAAVVAVVAAPLPYKLGLIAAAFAGVLAGVVTEARNAR